MADLTAPPRNAWLGGVADLLSKVRDIAHSNRLLDPMGISQAIETLIGQSPEALDRYASGFKMPAPIQETGPDPSLAAKYGPVADVAGMLPVGSALKVAGALAHATPILGAAGTLLDRSHLIQLAKTDPAMVERLETARKASLDTVAAGGTPEEAWRAGSAHLEGTPYAGWLPAQGAYPDMFEVTDTGARISPRFDPRGESTVPGQLAPIVGTTQEQTGPLGLSYQHPDLEKFVPGMQQWRSDIRQSPAGPAGGGGGFSYGPSTERLGLAPMVEADANNPKDLLTTLIHETQHGAAAFGNLPRGTNFDKELFSVASKNPTLPNDYQNYLAALAYNNNPGEVLARTAEARRFLPAQDLRNTPPTYELAAQVNPEPSWLTEAKTQKWAPDPDNPGGYVLSPFSPESAQLSPMALLLAKSLGQ